MNKNVFFLLILFITTPCFCADGSRQKAFDQQIVEAGESVLGLIVRLFSSQAAVEHAQAQRRLSEEKPELLEGPGLVLARTPEERRRLIQQSWVRPKEYGTKES